MDTVAQKCWVIRDVAEEEVTMEEQVNGEPNGRKATFARALLPDDVRPGDEFRVVAQINRKSEDILSHPAFGEATEALAAGGFNR